MRTVEAGEIVYCKGSAWRVDFIRKDRIVLRRPAQNPAWDEEMQVPPNTALRRVPAARVPRWAKREV